MAKVLNLLKTIRNNWKKSVLGVAAFSYGISYGKQTYDAEQLMRQCCEDVAKYGDTSCSTNVRPRHVTVILNPAAKRRKAKKLFEKYCEPLLHLAGISTTIIDAQSGSHVRNVITNLETPTDAIIVAGGDGTLSDVTTGLMRKYEHNLHSVKQCPIGVLPLGSTNTIASMFYRDYKDLADIHHMIDATMAIIKNNLKLIDAIEIKLLENDPENSIKPVYAVGSIKWGAWSDTHARIDKYWYWGFLRKYAAYVFNGYKSDLNWNCNAIMKYTNPCKGCSHCYSKELSYNQSTNFNRRWWHAFLPKKQTFVPDNHVDYSKVVNEDCGTFSEIPISTIELCITTENLMNVPVRSIPSLKIALGPKNISYTTFVEKGWKQEMDNELPVNTILDAKNIELYPEINENQMLYIDYEEYELKPIQIKLLPQSITIFCPEFNR
ncbi:Acylglycerol kinase, mitochondrial [Camponotus floridanus]|uniref:Acylglycerol kinase, mitochondrial n=1 Tax=Camponotus floridanus TaxID=104421 RepID=E2AUW3_CAMFO|nr:acylglycerol kinase, mitochondrial [Camponotus floridanus]EFN62771.1 Acylglycerol kinase, mitochondrial [Camponotus floridanus]